MLESKAAIWKDLKRLEKSTDMTLRQHAAHIRDRKPLRLVGSNLAGVVMKVVVVNRCQQWALLGRDAFQILHSVSKDLICRPREILIPFCFAHLDTVSSLCSIAQERHWHTGMSSAKATTRIRCDRHAWCANGGQITGSVWSGEETTVSNYLEHGFSQTLPRCA